jgi:tetratricopeptide (TPR) repeat protein
MCRVSRLQSFAAARRSSRDGAASVRRALRYRFISKLPGCAGVLIASVILHGCGSDSSVAESKKFDPAEAPANLTLVHAKRSIQRWARWYWSDGASDHHYLAPQFEAKELHFVAYYPSTNKKVKYLTCRYENYEPVIGTYTTMSNGAHKGQAAYWTRVAPIENERCKDNFQLPSPNEVSAKEVAAAFLRWKNSTIEEREAFIAEQSRVPFSVIDSYVHAKTKPVLPEEVRRFRVVAEAAVREKRFGDAATAYENGLEIAPWWAQGHFDAALILAEIYYYKDAVDHMRQYLQLSPDAKDARAVQDKIYEWEDAYKNAGE